MKTKIASVVAALAFMFVAGASAQDSAGKTDWREQYASPGKDKSEVHKRRSPRGVAAGRENSLDQSVRLASRSKLRRRLGLDVPAIGATNDPARRRRSRARWSPAEQTDAAGRRLGFDMEVY